MIALVFGVAHMIKIGFHFIIFRAPGALSRENTMREKKDQQKYTNGNTKIAKQSIVLKFIMYMGKYNPNNFK